MRSRGDRGGGGWGAGGRGEPEGGGGGGAKWGGPGTVTASGRPSPALAEAARSGRKGESVGEEPPDAPSEVKLL